MFAERQYASISRYSSRPNSRPYFSSPLVVPKGTLALAGQLFGWIDDVHSPLLKLHRVAVSCNCDADQTLREVDVAVVVDADLSDDIARLPVPMSFFPDLHRSD